jgi:hypothetical protein
MKITNSSIPSSKSSTSTLRRRSNEMSRVRKVLSVGDESVQMSQEIRMIPKEERNELMKNANFHIVVPPEEGLAMKADLCLPWKKLRMMRRCSIYSCLYQS